MRIHRVNGRLFRVLLKAYPSKQLPSVTEVISEFIAIFQKLSDWRGLDDEEIRLLGTLKQIWINWYDDATATEGSDLSTLSGKSEAEVVALKSDGDFSRQGTLANFITFTTGAPSSETLNTWISQISSQARAPYRWQ